MSQTIAAIATTIGIIAAGIVWYLRQYRGREQRITDEIVKLQGERDKVAAQMLMVFHSRPFDSAEYIRLDRLRETYNRRIARLRSKISSAS